MEVLSDQACHGGRVQYISHESAVLNCTMRFSVFLPPQVLEQQDSKSPVLWWLSGLTCSEDNFTVKAGAYETAAELGLVIIAPDTSPRGDDVADDEAYDLGQGAGFYLDATAAPWSDHFKMYSYVTRELQEMVCGSFPVDPGRQGIFGHSMGGHGALSIGIKNPATYRSISAFAPIVNPLQVPWGQKAFNAYLAGNEDVWPQYDSCALMQAAGDRSSFPEILVDQGEADNFMPEQLQPEQFAAACVAAGQKLRLRMQPGYDHSYFFITSFIGDHLRHHAAVLSE